MAIVTKVEPLERDVSVLLPEDLSDAAKSEALAGFARDQLADAEAVNAAALGAAPPYETIVDGRQGAEPEDVKPDGIIVFEFALVADLLRWIMAQLIAHSPVLHGRYRNAHLLFADGVEVRANEAPPEAHDYVFLNARAYARKIERGASRQAPSGVYEAVAAMAQRRFGNVARVSFGYQSPLGAPQAEDGGDLQIWAEGRAPKHVARLGRRAGRRQTLKDLRNPAIFVRVA